MKKNISIAFAGGGTGGHVRPIESLIQYADTQQRCYTAVQQIFWFGEKKSFEATTAKELREKLEHVQLHFCPIVSGKFRRETRIISWLRNIRDVFVLLRGIFQCIGLLRKHKIDVVFCKGGFVALPVVIAAKIVRRKIFVHESDTRPGLVNTIASRWSSVNFVGFPSVLPREIVVGQILSDALVVQKNVDDAVGLEKTFIQSLEHMDKPVVFVTGGSLGARVLYQTLADVLAENEDLEKDFVFVVVLGMLSDKKNTMFSSFRNVYTFDFLSPSAMGHIYRCADIVLMRAGTTSLAEAALFDAKLCIVPLPITHDQKRNAQWYAEHRGDIVLDQTKERFVLDLEKFLRTHTTYKKTFSDTDRVQIIRHSKKTIWEKIVKR